MNSYKTSNFQNSSKLSALFNAGKQKLSMPYPHLSNGFVEGINNRTKVIKRTSYGYRDFSRFRAKILAQHFIKNFDISVG
ncbi:MULTISPECIES: transposase [Listeria]|uniref:transposase n=1 Tax=Listeria TaxID=1637 RepID=UPI001F3FC295|nr:MULTISPECIES: transposase [Listeria]WAO23339.1 transposase [Listeria newyorkensis]